jgi:butyryl-CoA dehydrogenase
MDLRLSEELRMVRDLARDFTEKRVRPLSAQIERDHRVPRELMDELAQTGLLGVAIPEEYGGRGWARTGLCLVMEEVTRGDFSVAVTYGAHASIGAMSLVGGRGAEARWLPQLARGLRARRLRALGGQRRLRSRRDDRPSPCATATTG